MPTLFLDTSCLAKLYVDESGSEMMLELLRDGDSHRVVILDISRLELRSAVRRREREGDLVAEDVANITRLLDEDIAEGFLLQPLSTRVIEEAMVLIDRYPLRAYDAVQLAGALTFAEIDSDRTVFVCSDHSLLRAADAEGMSVLDPTTEPL